MQFRVGGCHDAAARVRRATPPKAAEEGEGRINAPFSRLSLSIRVLSPRIEPPERAEDGSTASTATRRPSTVSIMPKLSIKVDLPTPGVPESPMRSACRPERDSTCNNSDACRR